MCGRYGWTENEDVKEEETRKAGTQRKQRNYKRGGVLPQAWRGGEGGRWGNQNGWMVGLARVKVYGVSHRFDARGTGTDTGSTKDGGEFLDVDL